MTVNTGIQESIFFFFFCVPGDLLFALVVQKYGLRQQMHFCFSGMVGDNVCLQFPISANQLSICDRQGKTYLSVKQQGCVSHNSKQIESFIRSYVAFSGLNFTHVLVPLMKAHQVMINPQRPLVIYDSMSFELTDLHFTKVKLELLSKTLLVNGKRGDVTLEFALYGDNKQIIGIGRKTLVLSGLRPYEEDKVQAMCDLYSAKEFRQAS